jgi:hypothetical protein
MTALSVHHRLIGETLANNSFLTAVRFRQTPTRDHDYFALIDDAAPGLAKVMLNIDPSVVCQKLYSIQMELAYGQFERLAHLPILARSRPRSRPLFQSTQVLNARSNPSNIHPDQAEPVSLVGSWSQRRRAGGDRADRPIGTTLAGSPKRVAVYTYRFGRIAGLQRSPRERPESAP